MKNKMKQWRSIYIVLLLLSLTISGLLVTLAKPLEKTRIGGGLLPLPCLLLRDSYAIYIVISLFLLILFAISWKFKRLNTASSVAIISTIFCFLMAFTMFLFFGVILITI